MVVLSPRRSRAVWLLALMLASGWLASGLPSAQVFRSGTSLRVLDVVVTDSAGTPVEGLGPDDFQVTEDGVRRSVVFVTPVSVPLHQSPSRRQPSDSSEIWTNDSAQRPRVFAVVIDDLNTRASDTPKAKAVVRRFLDRLPAGDLASVVFTGQQTGAQEFTSDRGRLLRSLDPEALDRLRSKATTFSINEGETKTVDLKIATAS